LEGWLEWPADLYANERMNHILQIWGNI